MDRSTIPMIDGDVRQRAEDETRVILPAKRRIVSIRKCLKSTPFRSRAILFDRG